MGMPWRRDGILVGSGARTLGLGALVLAAGGALAWWGRRPRGRFEAREQANRLRLAGGAVMAASVLADSSIGHYGGNFFRRLMLVAPPSAAATLAASLAGPAHWTAPRRGVLLAAAAIGLVGNAFHLYNVGKRTGGFGWLNLFYGAPPLAPAALSLAALLSLSADRTGPLRRLADDPRLLLGLVAVGLAGNVGEVAVLHYRGAFHNRYMVLPLAIPAAAAGACAVAAARPAAERARLAAGLLAAGGLTGAAGIAFHAFGIHRNMGGWGNASQMVLQGPPLGAPPSFIALALAGLGALAEMGDWLHD